MKTNFKTKKESPKKESPKKESPKKESPRTTTNLTQEEFEDYVSKSGAAGSFMIFRSKNKKDELGIDEV